MGVCLYRTGPIAAFPQRPRSEVLPIHKPGLPPRQPLHQLPQSANCFAELQDQVHMIPHQAESVHLYAVDRFEVFQRAQLELKFRFLRKHRLPVVPSLHYVTGVIRDHDSPKSRRRSVCAFT